MIEFPVSMRAAPTASNLAGNNDGSAGTPSSVQHADVNSIDIAWDGSGSAVLVELTQAYFSAEL